MFDKKLQSKKVTDYKKIKFSIDILVYKQYFIKNQNHSIHECRIKERIMLILLHEKGGYYDRRK